jgi:hypothetical protein
MATLSARDILTFAGNAGFSSDREEAVIATAIALAESSGNPRAHNDTPATGDDSYGLWQINMIGELGPERRQQFGISENEQLFDPATNAHAARIVFKQQTFNAWSVFKNERYKDHLDRARQAAILVDFDVLPEEDLTTEELLDALRSPTGQAILRDAVRHELRVATGKDDATQPAGAWFNEVKANIRAIKNQLV